MTVCNIHVDIQRSLPVVLATQYQRGYIYLTLGYFDTIDLNDHTATFIVNMFSLKPIPPLRDLVHYHNTIFLLKSSTN